MTLGSHQRIVGKSQTHLTPRFITDALGPFDLDPCASDPRPWDIAKTNFIEAEDGLSKPWNGFVWCNPPFDSRVVGKWMLRMAAHRNGIALLHARTETKWFRVCWEGADAFLFLFERLNFLDASGKPGIANSGAPPVLIAFGEEAKNRLEIANSIKGAFVTEWAI